MKKDNKKVATYCRVDSGNAEGNRFSLDTQKERLLLFAKEHDIEIVRQYEDIGVSGRTLEREGLQRLINDYKAGAFDAVLVVNISRLARDRNLYQQLPFPVIELT